MKIKWCFICNWINALMFSSSAILAIAGVRYRSYLCATLAIIMSNIQVSPKAKDK